jgi:TRAP-type C4-dicarboxylate transport system permease small subunit
MKSFFGAVLKVTTWMQAVAATALTLIILITTVDVLARLFGKPLPGAVEVIAILGGVVAGFTAPITSWMKGHIQVDVLLNLIPQGARNIIEVMTRIVAIGLCLLVAWNCLKIATDFWSKGEVSGTLLLPLFPICYGLAACFFVLSIVLFCDILKIYGGSNE